MNKILVLLFGLFMSLSASAVKVHELTTTSNQEMFDGLLEGVAEAATEIQNMSKKPTNFVRDYVKRFKGGTISSWKLIDKRTDTVVDYWYSRNGKDIPWADALMEEHVIRNLGEDTTVQRPKFARRSLGEEYGVPEPVTVNFDEDKVRLSDAEIKAIQRGFRTKQRLGLQPKDLILEGYVDKPNCDVCKLNLEHFEGVGGGKVAGEIRIFHYSETVHNSSFRRQRANLVAEITGCH